MLRKPMQKFGAIALTTASLLLLLTMLPSFRLPDSQPTLSALTLSTIGLQAAEAQSIPRSPRPADVWRQVYEILPDFPLENDYISTATGEVAADNTLASRLIRYHIYVKSRPPNYRLDWKLTLADYLDAHQWVSETLYPSADTLRTNPRDGDLEAIRSLNRAERDALIQALVTVFAQSQADDSRSAPGATTPRQTSPTGQGAFVTPLPQPGDAQLLMP